LDKWSSESSIWIGPYFYCSTIAKVNALDSVFWWVWRVVHHFAVDILADLGREVSLADWTGGNLLVPATLIDGVRMMAIEVVGAGIH
jgi:hypothetical protein